MKFLKKSKKLIIGIIIGLIVGSVVSVYAAYSYLAQDVSYTKSDGTEISVKEALDQLYEKQNVTSISTSSAAGCYADVNDDGTVDGVIFVDLAQGASGQWGDNGYGTYSYPAVGVLRNYKISTKVNSYSGQFGTKAVIAPNGTMGNARFYVMTLSDYGGQSRGYSWSDASSIMQTVGSVTFRLPSNAEWSAFGGQFGITISNYSSTYGLLPWYWSSSGSVVYFGMGRIDSDNGNGHCVRLCATF